MFVFSLFSTSYLFKRISFSTDLMRQSVCVCDLCVAVGGVCMHLLMECVCMELLMPLRVSLTCACRHVDQSMNTFVFACVCVNLSVCECASECTAVLVKGPLQLKWKCMQWPTPKWVPLYPTGHILWGKGENKRVCVYKWERVRDTDTDDPLLCIHLDTKLPQTLLIGLVGHRVPTNNQFLLVLTKPSCI